MTDEEYVRSKWSLVHRCDGSYRAYPRGTVLVQDVHGNWLDCETWAAAAEFTRAREKQIAEIEEEIEDASLAKFPPSNRSVRRPKDRILFRLNTAKAELQRGMLAEPRRADHMI